MSNGISNPASGAPGATQGGAPNSNPNPSNPPPDSGGNGSPNPAPQKTVSREDHDRALTDLHRFKEELRTLKEQQDSSTRTRLEQENNYKALYETERQKHSETQTKLKELNGWMVQTHRFGEVKSAAVAAGIRKEALADLELLDLTKLPTEVTSTGRFIVNGVDHFVEGLKTGKPHWFHPPAPPTVNGGGGNGSPANAGKLTAGDVAAAERKFRTGQCSRQEYHDVHQRYVEQNRRK